jgi:autotransporter-associated beta strand protein
MKNIPPCSGPASSAHLPRPFLSLAACIAVFAVALGISPEAQAQSSWSVTPTDGQATNGANWQGGVAPADGTSWAFANSSILAVTNAFTSWNVAGLTFATNAGAYTISGNAFTLTGGITNAGSNTATISTALTINGTTTISTAPGRLFLNGAINGTGSIVKNGSGTLNLGVTNTFQGGVTINDGTVRPGANSGVVSGTVTGGSFGTGSLTINGGRIMPGGAGALNQPSFLVNSNFAVNLGTYNATDNGRLSIAGLINLQGGTRTVTLGRWTNAIGTLAGGQESFRFLSNNLLPSTLSNGTIRFVRDNTGDPTNYASVNFSAGMIVSADAAITIGSNIITTFATSDAWETNAPPSFTVETNGIFNMSTDVNARSIRVRTLSGNGLVTSLANSTSSVTSTLTISNASASDAATFSGSILTGTLLNATLGTSNTNVAISLVKAGAGTQILTGSNSYTGTTTISGGVLQVGSGGTTGNVGSGAIANNGTLIFNRSDDLTQGVAFASNAISGSGRLVKGGAGTLTLNTNNTFTGGATLAAGAVSISVGDNRLGAAPGAFTSDALIISNGSKLIVNGTNNITFNANRGVTLGSGGGGLEVESGITVSITNSLAQLTGPGGLTKTGAGTLALLGPNDFSGGAAINGGWVQLRSSTVLSGSDITAGPLGTGDLTINGGGLLGGGGQTLNATNISINGDFGVNKGPRGGLNGRVSLGANLINLGGATRTVALGAYTNAAGALQGGIESLRFISNATFFTPVITNGSFRFVRDPDGGSSDFASVNFGVTGMQFAGGGFTVGTNVITTFAPGNAFTNAAGALPHVTVESGGILSLGTSNGVNSQTIRSLSGSAGFVTTLATLASNATATLTISNEVGDYNTFSGQIVTGSTLNASLGTTATNGIMALTKTGAGTQVLNGANTYGGNTTINNGLLELGPSGSLTFNIGNSGVNNTITGSGSAFLSGTFVFNLANASTNASDSWTIVSSGTTKTYVGGFSVAGFTNSGGTWYRGENGVTYLFTQSNSVLSVGSVPPPPTNPFANWLTNYPSLTGTNALPGADPDADGFDNQEEFAFGGDPTKGSPALLQATKVGTNANISFIADTNALTYQVESRTNLATPSWTNVAVTISNAPDQSGVLLTNYVRRQFTVPASGRSFYRVLGTQAP